MKPYFKKFNKINKVNKTITIFSVFFYLIGTFSLIVNPMIIDTLKLDISSFSYSTLYQVLTYPFVHDFHPLHLLFNLALLILFGNVLEKEIGVKNYILLFVFGWVFNFLPMMFLGSDAQIAGLSGIVSSIMVCNIFISKNTSRCKIQFTTGQTFLLIISSNSRHIKSSSSRSYRIIYNHKVKL